jgi:hypothetical protein
MEFGNILNTFVADAHVFLPLTVAAVVILFGFSLLYNGWMDKLGDKKDGYTAILVGLGDTFTLVIVAVFSWKAALIVFLAFVIDGAAMIYGDIRRSSQRREEQAKINKRPRRKCLPYAAASLVTEAIVILAQVERGMKQLLEGKLDDRKLGVMALAVKDASHKLQEAVKVEGE